MRHSILKRIFLISILALLFCGSNAWAEDDGPTATADVGIFNKYIWRGYELNNNSIVIQPSVTMGYKGFSVNGWANIDTDSDADKSWNETDLTLSYETSIGSLTLGGGCIFYSMVDADDTKELYVSAGYDSFLSPTLSIYKDIDLTPGYYINLGLSHSINVTEEITLDLSGGLGYYISCNDDIVEADTDKRYRGLQDGLISAGLTIPINKSFTVSPSVSYSFALSNKAEESLGISKHNFFGGIVLSYSF